MENLSRTIETIFLRQNPEDIIQDLYRMEGTDWLSGPLDSSYIDITETIDFSHNRDELKNIDSKSRIVWFHPVGERQLNGRNGNIFYSLLHYTKDILVEHSNNIVCEFSQLLRWRELSYKLGEDIFTTAYLANSDLISKRARHFFAWSPTLKTNNKMLNSIYDRGLSELHFHLYGSSLNFDIGWLSLMNDISGRTIDFERIYKLKFSNPQIYQKENVCSLYVLYIKACAIRVYLFTKLTKITDTIESYNSDYERVEEDIISTDEANEDGCDYENKDKDKDKDNKSNKEISDAYLIDLILRSKNDEDIRLFIPELMNLINSLKVLCGRKYGNECIDYAIRAELAERCYDESIYINTFLSGERWIMYKMFKKIFSQNRHDELSHLFYAYLIIKERIRQEMIQLNDAPGFANFQEYQNRKCQFIKEGSIYEKLLVSSAISNVLLNQNVNYLEARLSPKGLVADNIKIIDECDTLALSSQFHTLNPDLLNKESIEQHRYDKLNKEFYYIFHFIKIPEADHKFYDDTLDVAIPRHQHLRRTIKQQAQAINIIRKEHVCISNRIIGIDAASSEIGVRPEVFAQAYRYLKRYSYEDEDVMIRSTARNPLGFTYHVGEDYLDIADGLRAVDEVMKFLRFGRGDRLGHSLVLGVNAEEYYKKKKCRIVLCKHDYLDNIVWLLNQIKTYNIQVPLSLINELEDKYWRLYSEIYVDSAKNELLPPSVYFQAWQLRGDDPKLYSDMELEAEQEASMISSTNHKELQKEIFLNKLRHFQPLTFWERCGFNEGAEFTTARNNIKAVEAFIRYHFDPGVKARGNEKEEFKISNEYIKMISLLQAAMRMEIAERHIAIETNPTSNKKIGALKKYVDHPITKFYNQDLELDYEKVRSCPQISVSINTDDLGVFDTNLENEYALMAIAMEKEKDENGAPLYCSRNIYNWLEAIRQMGEEQRFIGLYE